MQKYQPSGCKTSCVKLPSTQILKVRKWTCFTDIFDSGEVLVTFEYTKQDVLRWTFNICAEGRLYTTAVDILVRLT